MPGGFGERGIEGKVEAIRFAREREIPFFGICLGMQCAVIEFARNVVGLAGAHSTEFNKDTPHPVICLLDEQKTITDKGGTMRLGAQPAQLDAGQQGGRLLRRDEIIASGTGIATSSTTSTASSSRPTGCSSPAPAPTARWSRSSSCPTIPGSWRCSSIPEFKSKPTAAASAVRRLHRRGASSGICARQASTHHG